MGEAIETTTRLYPGLLEHNLNLLFMLKCRQFVEMVNGSDSEVRCSSRSHFSPPPRPSTPTHASVIHSTKAFNGNGSSSSRWVFFPASFFEGSWYKYIIIFSTFWICGMFYPFLATVLLATNDCVVLWWCKSLWWKGGGSSPLTWKDLWGVYR